MIFLSLLAIPVLIALLAFAFGKGEITLKEFGIHLLVQLIIAIISAAIIYHYNVTDIETLNGSVTNKERVRVHCRHSYPCNPYPCACGKSGCSTCWHTCYLHSYDIDWDVYTNIGDFTIDTIDSQGLKEPPRWTVVQKGDPVVRHNSYDNYIKGAPGTLFKYQGLTEKYASIMATYPASIYDYYKKDRVVTINYPLQDLKGWNEDLSKLNSKVGYDKECNVILVIGSKIDRDYFYALSQHWIGGKKNDIIVVIDMDGTRIEWVQIMAWTDQELFKVRLRDEIYIMATLDRAMLMQLIDNNVRKLYVRKSMKDFQYLQASIKPTTTQWIWAMVIGVIASIFLAIFFYREDVA